MDGIQAALRLCGIDEAGRGPLAGPLVVAGVILSDITIEGLADSKKLTAKKREALYRQITDGSLYHIVIISHDQIDTDGLSHCLNGALVAIKETLGGAHYLFDGNTSFGVDGIETMVKADTTIPAVSAASILAKVMRDGIMDDYAQNYPLYGFDRHKGYGTKAHLEAIMQHGRCAIHRKSFKIKGVDKPTLF